MAKAIKDPKAPKNAKGKSQRNSGGHVVVTEFRDINNFDKVYEVGDDVSHLESSRLTRLVEMGYVEVGDAVGEDQDSKEDKDPVE